MSDPRLILVYAGYGDTSLLEYHNSLGQPRYWLIDGGPVDYSVQHRSNEGTLPAANASEYNAYYQFLKAALRKFCASTPGGPMDRLEGIIVTHPDADHVDGIVQLLIDWPPGAQNPNSPLMQFTGPVILNDLFFVQNNKDHYRLCKLLIKSNFKKAELDYQGGGSNIPPGMINRSTTKNVYKMVIVAPGQADPVLIDRLAPRPRNNGPNASSIITIYPNSNLRIVTTGDAFGAGIHHVLQSENQIGPNSNLGIFRVPHHGSYKNSQSLPNPYKPRDAKKEKLHFLFMILSAAYFYPQRMDPRFHFTADEQDYIRRIYERDTTPYFQDWHEVFWASPRGHFDDILDYISTEFYRFIGASQFVYTNTGEQLNLARPEELATFLRHLIQRYINVLAAAYTGDVDLVRECQVDYLGLLTPNFDITPFLEGDYLPIDRTVAFPSFQNKDPMYQTLVYVLQDDPATLVLESRLILHFYKSFNANNYAISANGTHEHPHAPVVAGILSAAISRNPHPSNPLRLFVTSGPSLWIDRIRAIIRDLIPDVQPQTWDNYVTLYYLRSNFFTPISVTLTGQVENCESISLYLPNAINVALEELKSEFERLAAYDLPRATVPDGSNFIIEVMDDTAIPLRYDGNTFQMDPGSQTTFLLCPQQAELGALNSRQYGLIADNLAAFNTFPHVVAFFNRGTHQKRPVFIMSDLIDHVVLCNTGGGVQLQFLPLPQPEPVKVVLLGFKRGTEAIFGSQLAFTARPTKPALLPALLAAAADRPLTLEDVVTAEVGDTWDDYVLAGIPPKPFALYDIAEYEVLSDVNRDDPFSSCYLRLPRDIIIPGLGTVVSLKATVSSSPLKLKVDAEIDIDPPVSTNYEFGSFSLENYLQSIGYQEPKPSMTELGITLVGRSVMSNFLFGLPPSLTTFPTQRPLASWPVDAGGTRIAHYSSPFGTDVRLATIALDKPESLKDITIGAFTFSLSGVTLTFASNTEMMFNIDLGMELGFAADPEVKLQMKAICDGKSPVSIDFKTSSSTVPLSILKALGIESSKSIRLPLRDADFDLSKPQNDVGFILMQPCIGTTAALNLEDVHFRVSQDTADWQKVLPKHLQPAEVTELSPSLTVNLLHPTHDGKFFISLKLGYEYNISGDHSNMLFGVTFMQSDDGRDPSATIATHVDSSGEYPAPPLDDVLKMLFVPRWPDITSNTIPMFGSMKGITVSDLSVELSQATINGFSMSARVTEFSILANPSLILHNAEMTLDYNDGWQSGELAALLDCTDNYRFDAIFVLPSESRYPELKFDNTNDGFTFEEVVTLFGLGDPDEVPIIGGDALSAIPVDGLSIRFDEKLVISSVNIRITWTESLGPVSMLPRSRLQVKWQRDSLVSVDSLVGPAGDPIAENHWIIQWDGAMSESWRLSAALQRSTAKIESAQQEYGIVSGILLNTSADSTMAKDLTNALATDPTGKPSTLWQDVVPPNVTSAYTLKQCIMDFAVGELTILGAAAEASWGSSGFGTAALFVQRAPLGPSPTLPSFAFAISVKDFKFTDLFADQDLAMKVDSALNIEKVSIMCFNSVSIDAVKERIQNMSTCGMLPLDHLPLGIPVDSTSFKHTSGAAVFSLFDFTDSQPGSLTYNLAHVSKSEMTDICLTGFFGTPGEPTAAFTAKIPKLYLSDAVWSDGPNGVVLEYYPAISQKQDSAPPFNVFCLRAACTVKFSDESLWLLDGNDGMFILSEDKGSFSFQPQHEPQTLKETFELQMSNIKFDGTYTFGQTITSEFHLSANVDLGNAVSAFVRFDSGIPRVFLAEVPNEILLSLLVQKVFGDGHSVPGDVVDLSFSNLHLYYAWKDIDSFKDGFHANADSSVFGIEFKSLQGDILGGSDPGIHIEGMKETSVSVLGIELRGISTKTGPSFDLSTQSAGAGPHATIDAAFSLFGSDFGPIKLSYVGGDRFAGKVEVQASFIPNGGTTEISVELVHKDNENRLRFVTLPAIFKQSKDVEKALEDQLNNRPEWSECKKVDLDYKDKKLEIELRVDVNISDDDRQSPDAQPPFTNCNVDVTNGNFTFEVDDEKIGPVSFGALQVTVKLQPYTIEDFGKALEQALIEKMSTIMESFLKDREKLSKVLSLQEFDDLSEETIDGLACRELYDPPENPDDPPDPDQGGDSTPDGGGDGGDTGPGSGMSTGGSGLFGAAINAGISLLSGLFGFLFSLFSWNPGPAPSPPPSPGPLPPPIPDDHFGKKVYDILNKDFNRWKNCKTYDIAISQALECALEYRAAISILRKVLKSDATVKKLGAKVFADYTARRKMLVYEFSQLARLFGEMWLDMSDPTKCKVSMAVDKEARKLTVEWTRLHSHETFATAPIVTIYVDDTEKSKITGKVGDSTSLVVDIPPFDITQTLKVTVDITPLAANWDKQQKYVLYSQGKHAVATYWEWAPRIDHLDVTKYYPTPPQGLKYDFAKDPKDFPVLLLGPYRYWPFSYNDDRHTTGLTAQTQDLKTVNTWEKPSARYVYKMELAADKSTVTCFGENDDKSIYTIEELLKDPPPPPPAPIRVEVRDSGSQPTPPDQKYIYSSDDPAKYLVLVVNDYVVWPLVVPLKHDYFFKVQLLIFDGTGKYLKTFAEASWNEVKNWGPEEDRPAEDPRKIRGIGISDDDGSGTVSDDNMIFFSVQDCFQAVTVERMKNAISGHI